MVTNRRGFTLAELMVVITIIAILSALALPSFNRAVENSRDKEAVMVLEQGRSANKSYRLENAARYYASSWAQLTDYIEDPNNAAQWYDYTIENCTAPNYETFTIRAIRKNGTRQWTIDQNGVTSSSP